MTVERFLPITKLSRNLWGRRFRLPERETLRRIVEDAVDAELRWRWRSVERGGIDPLAVGQAAAGEVLERLKRAGLPKVPPIPPDAENS